MQQVAVLSALTRPVTKEAPLLLALEEAETVIQPGTPRHQVCAACPIILARPPYSHVALTSPQSSDLAMEQGVCFMLSALDFSIGECVSPFLPR